MFTHTLKTHGEKDLRLYKYRLNKIRLIWPQQILNLISYFNVKLINDLGCNYFQLYKEIKIRNKKYNYYGYDIEPAFIKLGLKKFPELNKKYKVCNIENTKLRKCDCSIISATLEHADNPFKILKNLVDTSKKIIIIRSYFGYKDEKAIESLNVKNPCNHNQFSFKKINKFFKDHHFRCSFILDEATLFSEKYKLINNKNKIKRKIYICLAIKN